jgi:6-phosphogluconolactonase
MGRKPPDVTVVADANELAETEARRISAHVAQTSGRIAVCLTGGSTPEPLYKLMATEPYRDALPWKRIHWFWGDLPQGRAGSDRA